MGPGCRLRLFRFPVDVVDGCGRRMFFDFAGMRVEVFGQQRFTALLASVSFHRVPLQDAGFSDRVHPAGCSLH